MDSKPSGPPRYIHQVCGRWKEVAPISTRISSARARTVKPTMKFHVIETSIDPVSRATAELPAGCQPASSPARNGRMARPITEGACQLGSTTSTVAATARIAPSTRGTLKGCFISTPMPNLSHRSPEMTIPEINVVWKVATPSTEADAPSENTTMAPHKPANQLHHGILPARIRDGIETNCCLVLFLDRMMTAMTTRPDPNDTTADALPSPNSLPT